VTADQPGLVVLPLELSQRCGQLRHRGEWTAKENGPASYDASPNADQRLVIAGPLRSALLRHRPRLGWDRIALAVVVMRGAWHAEHTADPRHAVGSSWTGGDLAAQGLGLLRTKGSLGTSSPQRRRSSSLSMVSSPSLAWRRRSSSSRPSAGRLFSAALPPARKSSRHEDRKDRGHIRQPASPVNAHIAAPRSPGGLHPSAMIHSSLTHRP
jgi:hypothetical protein